MCKTCLKKYDVAEERQFLLSALLSASNVSRQLWASKKKPEKKEDNSSSSDDDVFLPDDATVRHKDTLEAQIRRPYYLPTEDEEEVSSSIVSVEDLEEDQSSLRQDFEFAPYRGALPLEHDRSLPEGVKNRIRGCLQRAQSRCSSLSGFGSIEAGLYRLQGLLEDRVEREDDECKSESYLGRQFYSLDTEYRYGRRAPRMSRSKGKDAGTVTDICTSEHVAEVEVISLVEEQIPKYRLRADTYSAFSGVESEGWCTVPFPALKDGEVEALSPEQVEGTLSYFVLCGNRVSQMTKTYNDIEAVTKLLEEKERDVELAARIGQQLLQRNKALEERNAALEVEISGASDQITQLKHELQMKTDLLQIYTNDVEESSAEGTPTGLRHLNMDFLQKRVRNLEDENKTLRQEASQLAFDTQSCEDMEKELVTDVIKQLNDTNLHVHQLSDELAKKVEDSLRQQEEITQLLAQVVDLQARNRRLNNENDDLGSMVTIARECQMELTTELAELKERYSEVLELLHDAQEQLRHAQKKNPLGNRRSHLAGIFHSPYKSSSDSIANELNFLASGDDVMNRDVNRNLNKIFDTVKLVEKNTSIYSMAFGNNLYSTPTRQSNSTNYLGAPLNVCSSGYHSYFNRPGSVYSDTSSHPSLDSGADSDMSMQTDSEDNYPASCHGVPGCPGTPDLTSCIRRLGHHERISSQFSPYDRRTPDSIMSTGTGKQNQPEWKLPQKLQIVKPIEGSLTLRQWSRLATPHLGGLLEDREGVAMKGGTGVHLNLSLYSMSDVEEEEVEEENPGKRFMSTSGIFTLTNSMVLHPDDDANNLPNVQKAHMSVLPSSSSEYGSHHGTPSHTPSHPSSRRGSTATFSTNIGLAKMLNERGIHVDIGSPTLSATPANSPEGSRPESPDELTSLKLPGIEDLTKTFYYGANLLRRTFYGEESEKKRPQPSKSSRLNLVEKVQAIGSSNLIGAGSLRVGGVVTSRPPVTSPLLHLSNLIISRGREGVTMTTQSTGKESISAAPKIPSPGERRPPPPGAPLGIPGHPGSGLLNGSAGQLGGQRRDLGTVGNRQRPTSLGTVPPRKMGGRGEENMGTVGWMSLGRKGGLL